jgi:hypothetical protein
MMDEMLVFIKQSNHKKLCLLWMLWQARCSEYRKGV